MTLINQRNWNEESTIGNCDSCGKKESVIDVWFQGSNRKWCRHWCKGCLKNWKSDCLELSSKLENTIDEYDQPNIFKRTLNFVYSFIKPKTD